MTDALAQETAAAERNADFNFDWKFALQDDAAFSDPDCDDAGWREVRLPHDWSVEHSFDKEKGEGATGYLPGGIGWYRKSFALPEGGAEDLRRYIVFDGVYNNTEVWINGTKLGFHPYGYSPFYYDLTPHLRSGGAENVIAVRVDHSRFVDSRWYTGSGIYRNVSLVTVPPLHVPIWGTFITTPQVSAKEAAASIEIKVRNEDAVSKNFRIATEILDPDGKRAAFAESEATVAAGSEIPFGQAFTIGSPSLWSVDTPTRYVAVTSIVLDGKVIDTYRTPFGIRSIRFDPSEGFFLNGVNLKIKGVCLHHDGGLVGAAVPAGVWRRRLATLREGGCNAIRISHNPPSEEFLDLCDEMGFLVQNEFFDEWDNPKDKRLNKWETKVDYVTHGYGEHFQEWAERDLKVVMLRDRNHPSIIQWSIGNEIEWTYPAYSKATGFFDMDWKGNYFWSTPPNPPEKIRQIVRSEDNGQYTMAATAAKLAAWTREMDTTRPVAINCILPSASHESGVGDAVDIVGYSYRRVMYDYGRQNYPDKVIMGTENLPQWHEWKAIEERSFVSGTFLWTGIDYMGESNNGWPRKATRSGLLNVGGFKKSGWHMYRTLWNSEPAIHLATQTAEKSTFQVDAATGAVVEKKPGAWERALWFWPEVNRHWNYDAGESVIVEAYSNCAELELFLDGRSLGVKKLTDFPDRLYKWAVPFASGKLEALGSKEGVSVSAAIETAGAPAGIKLISDRESLAADAYDVAHLVAQLVDSRGRPVRSENRRITFALTGDATLLGVDNGENDNVQDYQSDTVETSEGRCLAVIRSLKKSSQVKVIARAEGFESAPVMITVR